MKIAGYISIMILLALGCAGRADKIKTDSGALEVMAQREEFKPAYPELIEKYNEERFDEFYSALDTIRIKQSSCVISELRRDSSGIKNPYKLWAAYWEIPIKIAEDSSLASILILDIEKKLSWIEYNDILPHGDYIYCNKLPNVKSGVYFTLLRIGTEEMLQKHLIMK